MTTFDSHPKSAYWSSRNSIKPCEVRLNSHKKFWFKCDKCQHEFESSLLNINQGNSWCPYCYNKKICGSCEKCYNLSFASHEKSKYWSSKNTIQPNEVLKGSEKKYYFECNKCDHEIFMSLKKISSYGHWCSYCSHQKLCDINECNMCFNNSFASVERSKFMNDKSIDPRRIFKRTNKKFDFDCDVCNKTFTCQLSDITRGVWCSFCVNKTELILYNKLKEKYDSMERQFKVNWCKNKTYLPYDFVIKDKNIIIELDGKQHFQQIGNWPTPEETQKIDLYKMKCANDNGFSVIRILQKDVYFNKYNWFYELVENIEKLTKETKVQNIYMCKKDEYKDFEKSHLKFMV